MQNSNTLTGLVSGGGTTYTTWPSQQTWNGVDPNWYLQQQQLAAMQQQAQAPKAKERKPMRGLFEVFVVDPESGEVAMREVVVADSDDKARLKVLRKSDVDPDDVDIIVRRIGDVRQKRRVQEVKVVKD
jgi:hypothetical protein